MAEKAAAAQVAAPATAAPVATETNKVTFGTHTQVVRAAGKTVREVKAFMKRYYAIPDDAQSYVNFNKVEEDYVLGVGEDIQFHRPAGDKG